jgi:hypothetical protein
LGSEVGVEVVLLVVSVLVVVLEDVVVVVAGSIVATCGDGIVEEGGEIGEVLSSISGFGSVFVPG